MYTEYRPLLLTIPIETVKVKLKNEATDIKRSITIGEK
jgi:hypothetical protein